MKIVLLSLIIFASLQAGASSERAGKKRLEQLRTEMKKEEKAERRKIENQKKEEEKVERQKEEEKAERQKEEEKAERQKEEEKVERQKEEEKVERQKVQTSLEEVPVVIMEEEIMPIKEAEKATVSKRELYKKRRELNESIEERIFKSSSKDLKTKIEVTKETYKLGKDRIDFLLEEENQLISLEKAIGIEKKPSETVYLNKKYDEIGEKIKKSNSVSEILMLENEKLESYLERLDGMEKELKNKM